MYVLFGGTRTHRLPNGVRTDVCFAEVPYIPIILTYLL